VETVDILLGIDRGEHGFGIDLLGKRKLHQNSVDGRIGTQTANQREQLLAGGGVGEPMIDGSDARFGAPPTLVSDVDLRSRVLADQHDSEAGGHAACRTGTGTERNFTLQFRGDLLTVEQHGG
jgi:hypothetical protein